MVDPFAMALDALFIGPGSLAAIYTAQDAEPLPIRVIRSQASEDLTIGGQPLPTATNIVLIRRADVAAPEAGDVVQIGSFAAVAASDPAFDLAGMPELDVEGLTWSLELLPTD